MVSKFRQLPFISKIAFILAIYTLAISILGNLSLFSHLGQMDIGVLRYWSPVEQCYRIAPATSPKWPAMQEGQLHINDCLISVDGVDLRNAEEVEAHLTEIAREGEEGAKVVIAGKRNGEPFQTIISPVPWTLADLLRTQLLLILPGLVIWITGLLVLLANPRARQNRALADFMLLSSMTLMGAAHWFHTERGQAIYDFLVSAGPRPFFGVLILVLALVFPSPIKKRGWMWATSIFWGLAILATGFKFAEFFIFQDQPQSANVLDIAFNVIVFINFFVGSGVFVIRSLYLWMRSRSLKVRKQAPFLVVAWLTTIPVIILDTLAQLPGYSWPLTGFTSLSVVGWLIPGAAMIAYAMLRYQAFAYRGRFLNILVVFFISVTIVQLYAMIIAPGGLDGLQWVMVWGAVLVTTLFFYVNSPLRRGFLRLFSRHSYDYEIVTRFSQTIRKHIELPKLLDSAATMLCKSLDVEWVGIWSPLADRVLYLARSEAHETQKIPVDDAPDEGLFPSRPVHVERLEEGGRQLGVIWFGPRSTAEPFDEQDEKLAELLAQDLARAIAVRSHIEQLEAAPGVIIEAVDSERRRIGQDIHDGVLQFLGGLPISLDRAQRMLHKNPPKAEAILDTIIDQALLMSEDARALVYDLSLPGVRQGGLVDQAFQHARTTCESAGVTLNWRVEEMTLWRNVAGTRAIHVYRILQESLYNAIQHGEPKQISVTLAVSGDAYVMDIIDDGKGVDMQTLEKQSGLGVISMRERARALGGRLWISSRISEGTTVRLTFPIRSAEATANEEGV